MKKRSLNEALACLGVARIATQQRVALALPPQPESWSQLKES
ncbi:MAG: hypothetical protein WBA57_26795 [Elainellaceae cyanobacterium]